MVRILHPCFPSPLLFKHTDYSLCRNKPELIDYADIYHNKTPEQRFAIAFGLVEENYSVPKLLDVEGSSISITYSLITLLDCRLTNLLLFVTLTFNVLIRLWHYYFRPVYNIYIHNYIITYYITYYISHNYIIL